MGIEKEGGRRDTSEVDRPGGPSTTAVRCATTTLPNSGLSTSRIGLGFAHAHLVDPEVRAALVHRALDLGITHFDTARLYSDGLSEEVLGSLLASRRSSVTITTKFGLLPTPLIASMGKAAIPLRKVRTLADKLRIVPYPMRSYSAATMRKSLQASLRALKTDYIDIYEIHEPLSDTELSDELIAELQRAKAAGTIRLIGLSGNTIDSLLARYRGVFDVIQAAESSWGSALWVPDITHSLFSDTANRASSTLPAGSIRKMLRDALARRSQGAVIVQTRSPDRLTQLVDFSQPQAR